MSERGGFGKIILFGEHFVVHNAPGIVIGLSQQTHAHVIAYPAEQYYFDDQRPSTIAKQANKQLRYRAMLAAIAQAMGYDQPIAMRLYGSLPVMSGGLGSSAAAAVACVRAIAAHQSRTLSDMQVEHYAQIGECAVHGNPSGIDTAAAVHGGIMTFQRNRQPKSVQLLVPRSLPLVIVDTGITSDTARVVAAVALLQERNAALFAALCEQYGAVYAAGLQALQEGNFSVVGTSMYQAHELLQQLGVSCTQLDDCIVLARSIGVLGAKLSGTGCGGIVVMLTSDTQQQHDVWAAFCMRGYHAIMM